jgi:voltage-gated potassium channel
MEVLGKVFEHYFRPFFGVLIICNILDQIFSSGTSLLDHVFFDIFFRVSMLAFLIELLLRVVVEKRVTFLLLVDLAVLINYYIIGVFDLRVLRILRAYSAFSQHRVLLPTNILLRTVFRQRYALMGSQVMVFAVLLIFSTLIHFIEREVYPEAFGSILSSMWFGITTLTTVGYGDITPITGAGKVLASFTMFLGIGMFALPAAILASAYYEEIQKRNFLISLEAISRIPLFETLPLGAIGKINSKLEAVLLPAGKTIIAKGDVADDMYIIEFGSVEVELDPPIILGAGDFFGESGLLKNTTRNASVVSKDEVKLLRLNKVDLIELMNEYEHLFEELDEASDMRLG